MSSRLVGTHWCTLWETLHVFDQGLISYITESLYDILGEKTAGKAPKNFLTNTSELLLGIFKDKVRNIVHVVQ